MRFPGFVVHVSHVRRLVVGILRSLQFLVIGLDYRFLNNLAGLAVHRVGDVGVQFGYLAVIYGRSLFG